MAKPVLHKRIAGVYRCTVSILVTAVLIIARFSSYGHDSGIQSYSSFSNGQRHLMSLDGNCTPAAIEQFPNDLFNEAQRKHGAILVHIIIALYMFVALAVVCDNYFVPALERISNALSLQPDVAGATFMAAGSSAPELATSVLAVFITKDDIGIGAVVGSAVFNIMLVIGVCALVATSALHLNWWPLSRDCVFYLISIFVMVVVIFDGQVTWYESVLFLGLYVAYCTFMCFNAGVESWMKQKLSCKQQIDLEKSGLLGSPDNDLQPRFAEVKENDSPDEGDNYTLTRRPKGCLATVNWILLVPLLLICCLTIPDVRQARWRKWFPLTFVMAIVWISAFSYVLVWMITVIGFTFGIPDTVMGLTFLAAGVSVPDLMSSVAVVKQGQGDMAVSNAIGSNVFDILLCLGLPWFLQTAIISPGSVITVTSRGLTYSTISLLSTVVFLLVAAHCSSWKLNKPLGYALLFWYVAFLVFACMYELNVIGFYNLPTCPSDF